jgi:hypothetical protein
LIRWVAAFQLLAAQAPAADLTGLGAGAINPAAPRLIAGFESSTGNKVTPRGDIAGAIASASIGPGAPRAFLASLAEQIA